MSQLLITDIHCNGGTQPRAELDQFTIDDYADNMANGDTFPPVAVFYDGAEYWLADGYHRLEAHKQLGLVHIEADIRQGTQRDAVLFSVGANAQHGKRRTNADKRRAVLTLLEDREWVKWSNVQVSKQCSVGESFVRSLRIKRSDDDERTYTTKHGTTTTMKIGKIGKSRPSASQNIAPSVRSIIRNTPLVEDTKALTKLAKKETGAQLEIVQMLVSGQAKTVQAAERLVSQGTRKKEAQSLPDKVFNVIYADPAWPYSNTGVHGAAEDHYDTMTVSDICELPSKIDLQIADNAVLFMWSTNPTLVDAFQVVKAWGFEYKTNMVWVKTDLVKPGSGFYVRGRHELLFICTRGSFLPLVDVAPPIGSVITAPVQEHSRKPDEAYDIIERLYPGCNYLELFARHTRPGWVAWGDEIERAI